MEKLERELAAIIAEHVTIGYRLDPGGVVNPDTIHVSSALGAAHMAIHFLKQASAAGGRGASVRRRP